MTELDSVVFWFEGHSLDIVRGCLQRGQAEVRLRPKSYAVLRCLVENANRLVSNEELIRDVWRDVFVTNDSLTQCIRELRAALADREHRIIKTVPRRGYLFAAPVLRSKAHSLESLVPAIAPRLSIAVLPFLNLSDNPSQEYLADGLTDNLTTDLAHIPGSFVIARSSAFTYKGKAIPVPQIGRELGVRYLLEGSVQRYRDRVRVNAQLIDAPSAAHIWAERYDREVADLFAVQDDITCQIALSLDVALREAESRRGGRERPTDPDATDLVMRGWAIWNRKVTPSNIKQAGQLFADALRIDSQSIDALVGLARMKIAEVFSHSALDPVKNIAAADECIKQALNLDQRNALAHLTRGLILRATGKLEAALTAFGKAIELNHNEVRAYVAIGDTQNALGRAESAIDALQHALRLDPRDHRTNIFAMLGWSHLLLQRDQEAIDWFRRSIHQNPTARRSHLWLACAYALVGNDDAAAGSLQTFRALMPEFTIAKNTAIDASDDLIFVRQRERLYAILRKMGVPE